MRKVFPNFDKEDGLETVLEVPIPEEMFASMGENVALRCQNMLTWMRAQTADKFASPVFTGRFNQLRFILYVVGSPLIPLQIQVDNAVIQRRIKDSSIQASTAKYIIQQYIAATGGQPALNAVNSMCVIGNLKIAASEFYKGDDSTKVESTEEMGGFVLWQKNPDLWCFELLVSGCKVCCGSNGKISWRQSSNQQSFTQGVPRPLRRFIQGLDPRATANLFLDAVCIGEKIINNEDCFILKLEANSSMIEEQSGPNYEIIHHRLWGYFSQRSGLLIQFEDSRLVRVNTKGDDGVFWETSSESVMEDYKYVDGVNVAHSGRTRVTVLRYGEESSNHKRVLEEIWRIDEVDFNIQGLSSDYFAPPIELKS
ncbi:Protein of unknown function DUF620 [Dillenia turbinata]|uniref:Uncharacterized protein n=1 Tax=Dillenia turbinata TaxID=194707 RepID=A0AAN8Z6W3_9MAGN